MRFIARCIKQILIVTLLLIASKLVFLSQANDNSSVAINNSNFEAPYLIEEGKKLYLHDFKGGKTEIKPEEFEGAEEIKRQQKQRSEEFESRLKALKQGSEKVKDKADIIYQNIIKEKDSLLNLSKEYKINKKKVIRLNNLESPEIVKNNQVAQEQLLPDYSKKKKPEIKPPEPPKKISVPHLKTKKIKKKTTPNTAVVSTKIKETPKATTDKPITTSEEDKDKESTKKLVTSGIPAGFEDLDQKIDTLVTVYFGNTPIIGTFATVDNQIINFKDPAEFINLIDNIKDKQTVIESLSGDLPTNSTSSCFPVRNEGCGTIDAKIAQIIYSPDIFRADLIINPKYLTVEDSVKKDYVQSNQKGISTITSFNNIFSGSNLKSEQDNYSINGSHLISYGNFNFKSNYNYSNDQSLKFDDLLASYYRKDNKFEAGFSSLQDLRIIGSKNFFGLGASSFLQNRIDSGRVYASKIQLFLPYNSNIRIIRNGRVIHSRDYEMGNQIIDTSSLPNGAYDIEIQITDIRGTTSHSEFFVKSSRMPPVDNPLYYFNIGFLEDSNDSNRSLPQISDQPIVRIGGGKRINKSLGLIGNIVAAQNQAALEGGIEYEIPNWRFTNNNLLTTQRDYGLQFDLESHFLQRKLNFNFSTRHIFQGSDKEYSNPIAFDPVSNDSSFYSLNSNYLLFNKTNIGFQVRRSQSGNSDYTYSYGPFFDKNIFRINNFNVNLRASLTKNNNETTYLFNIRTFYSKGHWSFSTNSNKSFNNVSANSSLTANSFDSNQTITWNDNDLLDEQLILGLNNQTDDNQQNSQRFNWDYRSRWGRLDGNITHDYQKTAYNSNVQFSLISNKNKFALGGRNLLNSGIIINVDSKKNSDAKFDVLVGNSKVESVKANSHTPVMLAPFRKYSVTLSNTNEDLSDFDSKPLIAELMPGNVVALNWQSKQAAILIGSAIFEDGSKLANAVLKSSLESSVTDEEGNFQIYAYTDDHITATLNSGKVCLLELKGVTPQAGGVAVVDEAVCKLLDSFND